MSTEETTVTETTVTEVSTTEAAITNPTPVQRVPAKYPQGVRTRTAVPGQAVRSRRSINKPKSGGCGSCGGRKP